MNKKSIDPTSPVPLFHQIAEAIREQIENGELSPGDALEPLREAASTWGVNLHTVRHAYTALAREGLLKSQGAKGTRVISKAGITPPEITETRAQFVGRFIHQANRNFGMDATTLAGEVASYSLNSQERIPVIFFVECSAWQSEAHASEIEARFRVEARSWSLEQEGEPPAGIIIATYFHYNDIRCRWPHRLHEVRFVTITPDPDLIKRLPRDVRHVVLYEKDQATADTLTADLSPLLVPEGYEIVPVVSTEIDKELRNTSNDTIALIAPRAWSSLGKDSQSNPRVFEANYVIKDEDLTSLGDDMGWTASLPADHSRTTLSPKR